MYGIRSFYKGKMTEVWYDTESDARSEGIEMDGNVFLLRGNSGAFDVIDTLKECCFEVGKEYAFRQYGVGDVGRARLITLHGDDAYINVTEASDEALIGWKRGKLIGGTIASKRGLVLYASNPV